MRATDPVRHVQEEVRGTPIVTRQRVANSEPGTAVILCTGINGLGAVRALSRRGVRVIAIYYGNRDPVRFSSAPHEKIRLPEPWDDAALIRVLATFVKERPVVIACSDADADFLSRCHDRLTRMGFRLTGPTGRASEILNDKARELELMATMPVTLPPSLVRLPHDADALLATLSLPIIVKPRSHEWAHLIGRKNIIASNRRDLEQFLDHYRNVLDRFVAQQVVTGPDETLWVCNCCFDEDGALLSAFTFQRFRMAPSHFGVTSFAVGKHNAEVKRQCAAIGKALRYSGPAMLEFKYDARTGAYRYIEMNPRIGMCNMLDTRSGVENVYTAYQLARGEKPEARPNEQVDDVVFLNVFADLYWRLNDGESILRVLRSYWATRHARHVWAYFDARDPIPFADALYQRTREITMALLRNVVAWLRTPVIRYDNRPPLTEQREELRPR